MIITNLIKIVLAILFFLCLLKMPYGFYELVRFSALVGFAILAYQAYQQKNTTAAVIYAALALMFQPSVKIALGRDLWNVIDVTVGIGLLLSLFVSPKRNINPK